MKFKKLTLNIHLWLGLASGLVVLIVGLTGCFLALQDEIEVYSKPWLFVKHQNTVQLSASALTAKLNAKLKAENDTLKAKVTSVQYPGPGRSASIRYSTGPKKTFRAYINPYTGQIIKNGKQKDDFFGFMEHGHRFLWLPMEIGRPIQGSMILAFLVLMITGIVLWWPKRWTKNARKKSLALDFKVSPKRLNYNLHNVLGFYMTFVMLFIVITGLCMSMKWFHSGVYWLTSGGKQLKEFKAPLSDTAKITAEVPFQITHVDSLWFAHKKQYPAEAGFSFNFPSEKKSAFVEVINPAPETSYRREFRYYDRYTMQDISSKSARSGTYSQASFADKIRKMNVDIHMGVV
ncbi:PepSY-associated TM helix domain-containing protein, partial [Mucilaginibacter sp. 5B2]|nr:PepSY-associated TM helix domain-containing protein [Mucilaginibacter sp. 5B2]